MLRRSLFEDMVVVHWLVRHDEDSGFLIRRYLDHLDAMRLNEATLGERAAGQTEIKLATRGLPGCNLLAEPIQSSTDRPGPSAFRRTLNVC
jgi:hypothetical protein